MMTELQELQDTRIVTGSPAAQPDYGFICPRDKARATGAFSFASSFLHFQSFNYRIAIKQPSLRLGRHCKSASADLCYAPSSTGHFGHLSRRCLTCFGCSVSARSLISGVNSLVLVSQSRPVPCSVPSPLNNDWKLEALLDRSLSLHIVGHNTVPP